MNEKLKISFFGIFLFLFSFFIYIRTSAPSVYFGDSGELISAIFTLGVPHPTGFPLYILTGKIFTFFPIGDISFRCNLLSSFFAALIPVLLFFILFILNKFQLKIINLFYYAAFSFLFIFSFTTWSQATITRIYTLNAFFCSLLLLLFLHYNEINKSDKTLYLMAFITGIGSGLHLTFIIFAIILWVYIIIKNLQEIKKNLIFLIFFFITGISIYFYIIIRGFSDITLNWHPFKSINDFFYYITQKQYKQKMFSREATGFIKFFEYIKQVIIREFSFIGFILFIFGVFVSFFKKFKYTILFLLLYIINIILLSVYGNYTDLKLSFRYFIPSYIIAIIFIFLLFNYIVEFFKSPLFLKLLISFLIIIFSFYVYFQNFKTNNRADDFIPYFYPYDILTNCGEKGYLFINGDNQIFTIAYLKFVKNKFKNITIFDSFDTIFKDINDLQKHSKSINIIPNVLTAFKLNLSPIFIATPTKARTFFEPIRGLINEATEKPSPDNFNLWKLYSLKGILHNPIIYDFEEREVVGTYLYRFAEYYKSINKDNIHYYLLEKAVKTAYDSVPVLGNVAIIYSEADKDYEKAEILIKKALDLNPDNEGLLFNLGSLHASKREFKQAIECFSRVITLNPLNFNARMYLEKAKQEYEQQINFTKQLESNNPFYEKGKKLMEQKKFKEAIIEFEKEIKQNPLSARAYFHIGLCYSILNQLDEAIVYYEKTLQIQPENISTLNNIGLCYLMKNEKEKAKAYFKKSLEIDKNQPKIQEIMKKQKMN